MAAGWKQAGSNAKLRRGRGQVLTYVRDGLVGEFLFGQDLLNGQQNTAGHVRLRGIDGVPQFRPDGGAAAIVYGDHEIELGNGMGFATKVLATDAQTMMIVTRVANVAEWLLGATADNGATVAMSYDNDGRVTVGSIARGAFARSANPLAAPAGDHRAIAVRVAGHAQGSAVMIDEFKGGVRVQGNSTPLPASLDPSNSDIVIGNNAQLYPNQVPGRNKTMAVLLWNRALSDAELLQSYLDAFAFAAGVGRAI